VSFRRHFLYSIMEIIIVQWSTQTQISQIDNEASHQCFRGYKQVCLVDHFLDSPNPVLLDNHWHFSYVLSDGAHVLLTVNIIIQLTASSASWLPKKGWQNGDWRLPKETHRSQTNSVAPCCGALTVFVFNWVGWWLRIYGFADPMVA
jgi:hypothetical protein